MIQLVSHHSRVQPKRLVRHSDAAMRSLHRHDEATDDDFLLPVANVLNREEGKADATATHVLHIAKPRRKNIRDAQSVYHVRKHDFLPSASLPIEKLSTSGARPNSAQSRVHPSAIEDGSRAVNGPTRFPSGTTVRAA